MANETGNPVMLPSKPRYLTKSRFKLAVECPRKLYFSVKRGRYQDTMAEDSFLEMLAEGGYQVGALAKLRYRRGLTRWTLRPPPHLAISSTSTSPHSSLNFAS
jgi:hypothetical protein